MEQNMIDSIKEQIDFLKADLSEMSLNVIPLNMGSEFQPQAVCKIIEAREATKRQILQLMNRLAGGEPEADDKHYYRQLLERIATDHSAIDAAKQAVEEMDDDDVKQETMANAVEQYEITKRSITERILARLG